jgi:predicted AlkP superfamily phosphohydrolase/phosphomutase
MDIVRSADMNKTPDVRSRAYLPNWCAEVDIKFVTPTLSAFSIVSLLQNAGTIIGIGDFRQEKGRGSYGTFSVASSEDMGDQQEIWDDITQEAREVQELAMEYPECADDQTRELMQFIQEERLRRAA